MWQMSQVQCWVMALVITFSMACNSKHMSSEYVKLDRRTWKNWFGWEVLKEKWKCGVAQVRPPSFADLYSEETWTFETTMCSHDDIVFWGALPGPTVEFLRVSKNYEAIFRRFWSHHTLDKICLIGMLASQSVEKTTLWRDRAGGLSKGMNWKPFWVWVCWWVLSESQIGDATGWRKCRLCIVHSPQVLWPDVALKIFHDVCMWSMILLWQGKERATNFGRFSGS